MSLVNAEKIAKTAFNKTQEVEGHLSILNDNTMKISQDFFSLPALPWGGAAIAGGTSSNRDAIAKHNGIQAYVSHVSNANSGYYFSANSNAILLTGGEKTTIVFRTAGLDGVTRRTGFHNSSDHNAPTNGIYTRIVNGVITGQSAANGVMSTSSTSYLLSSFGWYRLVIQLNTDATLATYTLFADDSTTVLWTETLIDNIPKITGREVSHRDVCTLASPTSAITIGYIDYMDMLIPGARKVA